MRDRKNRAKDILYIHDTIEISAGHLAELRELFATEVRPRLQAKKAREVSNAAVALFGYLDDTVREEVAMTTLDSREDVSLRPLIFSNPTESASSCKMNERSAEKLKSHLTRSCGHSNAYI